MPNQRSFAALRPVFVASLIFGCAEQQVPPATESELDDPEIRAQLQGSSGGGAEHPGAALYEAHCATCHNTGLARAPALNILQLLSPDAILTSLESGVMRQQASMLDEQQRRDVVSFLVGEPDTTPAPLVMCEPGASPFRRAELPTASGWGQRHDNTRLVSATTAGLTASDLASLEIRWVFDYPGASRARSQPSLAGGAVHVGSQSGTVYALDRHTGCVRWTYEAGAEVRTGLTIPAWNDSDTPVAYFADVLARTHAIDLETGAGIWKTKVDEHPNATATGQPVYFDGLVMQPISSLEVVPAADPNYSCCSFRGAIATLDAATGEMLRKTHTIPEPPAQVATNNVGVAVLAPSGAPVWNSPTVDTERRRLYFGTGENYSSPADGNSDAIIAMDIDSGDIVWVTQTTPRDAWNVACMEFIENKTNCPEEEGPDLDFGAPPMLVRADDREVLVAGQKSGEIFGLSVESGEILWRRQVGRGGVQGGMHFGMAAEGELVYVPISDYSDEQWPAADAKPGVYGLDAFTGELLWSQPADDVCGDRVDCDPGVSAAVTAIDGAVLAGHMDGRLRAYARDDGAVLWSVDTDREFTALSGRTARGGSFGGGAAPVAFDGMLYANSGYGLYFHRPGNVLIAWGLPEPADN
ncbi:MAG: PQQ-binding-like beta-propeller repeat protein [Pseudomonadota bacterium]